MTYRNTLLERSRIFAAENAEPAVLDYLQLRNRQCLQAWHLRRIEHALNAASFGAQSRSEAVRARA